MKGLYCRILTTTVIILILLPFSFAQASPDEALKHYKQGEAALKSANNEARFADAMAEFQKATEIMPNMAAAWYNLGFTQSKMGYIAEALESYNKYLVLAPRASDAGKVRIVLTQLKYRLEILERYNAKEINNDGRFVAYDNGTVIDTNTKLMWTARDNGGNINWENAQLYCKNYRGGAYTDWRMPKLDELAGLYDSSVKGKNGNKLTRLIELNGYFSWASDKRDSEAAVFMFLFGKRLWFSQSRDNISRVLLVRSAK